eukprot:COSAG06_NODE_7323_length_2546_cov_2.090723_3_plen_44_part_01
MIKRSFLSPKVDNRNFVFPYPTPSVRVIEEACKGAAHEAVDGTL